MTFEPLRSAIKGRRFERLTENETISSSSSADFAPFLVIDAKLRSSKVKYRGLSVAENKRKLALQKHAILDHMIRLISSYCPTDIRSEIEKKCTSLEWIWERISRHYGFSQLEVHFLKLASMKMEAGERYETYFRVSWLISMITC